MKHDQGLIPKLPNYNVFNESHQDWKKGMLAWVITFTFKQSDTMTK